MNGLLKADLAALESAHRKLEGSIGTQRLRAAEKAFAASVSPSPTANGSIVATPAPAPMAEQPPIRSASEQEAIDETLALARGAGIGRFTAAQEATTTATADDARDTLELARASGIGRFGQ